jgi:hypothetical protein
MANKIGNKRWGEVYKRAILVNRSTNTGLSEVPVPLADGEGVESPLLLASGVVGISAGKKLFFGDQTLFLRKAASNVLELGGAARLVVPTVSATIEGLFGNLGAEEAYASRAFIEQAHISNLSITGAAHAGGVSTGVLSAGVIAGEQISAVSLGARIIRASSLVAAPVLETDDLRAKVISAGTIIAASFQQNNVIACNVFANTKLTTPVISAAAVNGAGFESMMVWD